jgi:hypothetical protein
MFGCGFAGMDSLEFKTLGIGRKDVESVGVGMSISNKLHHAERNGS